MGRADDMEKKILEGIAKQTAEAIRKQNKMSKDDSINIDIFANMPSDVTIIEHPAFNDYAQDWRKVPEDTLIQALAEHQHPEWVITIPDDLMKYLESFRDNYNIDSIMPENHKDAINKAGYTFNEHLTDDEGFSADDNFEYLLDHIKALILDVEIYRQGLSQQVYKARIEINKYRIETLQRLVDDYVLYWRFGLEQDDVLKQLNKIYLSNYVMENSQRASDEQIFIPHFIGICSLCEDMGMNKTDSYLTLFEILKKLDYKDYRTADINKVCNKLKADLKVYRDRMKDALLSLKNK